MSLKQQLKMELRELKSELKQLKSDVKRKIGRRERVELLEDGCRPQGLWLNFWLRLVGHPDQIDHNDFSKLGKPAIAALLLTYPFVVWMDL